MLDQALGFLENELSQREVRVERLYEPGLRVLGDKDLLYRAFYNIISNGLQAIKGEGRISIAGIREGGHVILTFSYNFV